MTSINNFVLKNFIKEKIGNSLNLQEARDLKIENTYKEVANDIDIEEIEIADILDNDDLYEQFATLYTDEKEKLNTKDDEKEKEEENKVQGKNGAGI